MSRYTVEHIVSLLDLTSLGEHDTAQDIQMLCAKAHNAAGSVAAVCVYPKFIMNARDALRLAEQTDIAIATVVNFPAGDDTLDDVLTQTQQALANGADEIDVVLPYNALLNGDTHLPEMLLRTVCETAHQQNALVKVILETGALPTAAILRQACVLAIEANADFLKTSTGKIKIGATPEAVALMLDVIHDIQPSREIGIKIAGGVRTYAEAECYLELIESRMGSAWITPTHVRIGASSLLNDLLNR